MVFTAVKACTTLRPEVHLLRHIRTFDKGDLNKNLIDNNSLPCHPENNYILTSKYRLTIPDHATILQVLSMLGSITVRAVNHALFLLNLLLSLLWQKLAKELGLLI